MILRSPYFALGVDRPRSALPFRGDGERDPPLGRLLVPVVGDFHEQLEIAERESPQRNHHARRHGARGRIEGRAEGVGRELLGLDLVEEVQTLVALLVEQVLHGQVGLLLRLGCPVVDAKGDADGAVLAEARAQRGRQRRLAEDEGQVGRARGRGRVARHHRSDGERAALDVGHAQPCAADGHEQVAARSGVTDHGLYVVVAGERLNSRTSLSGPGVPAAPASATTRAPSLAALARQHA